MFYLFLFIFIFPKIYLGKTTKAKVLDDLLEKLSAQSKAQQALIEQSKNDCFVVLEKKTKFYFLFFLINKINKKTSIDKQLATAWQNYSVHFEGAEVIIKYIFHFLFIMIFENIRF